MAENTTLLLFFDALDSLSQSSVNRLINYILQIPCYFDRFGHIISGLKYIQLLNKQSLRNKPFCLAIGKDWTLRPSKTDLREIYTDLSWTHIHRKPYGSKKEKLKSLIELISAKQLREDGPVRILVKGASFIC